MKYTNARVGTLEKTNALKVLLALKKEGEISRATLYSMTSRSNRTVMERVNEFIAAGLVQEFAQQTAPFSRYLTVDREGKEGC